jgi:hypothetical protein
VFSNLFLITLPNIEKYFPGIHFPRISLFKRKLLSSKQTGSKSRKTIYQCFEKTLDDWVQSKKKHGIHNIINFHHWRYLDVFDLYIPQDYRRIIKEMVSFIHDLHRYSGCCTKVFDKNNIVFLNGDVKLWKIDFQPAAPREAKDIDYRFIERLVFELLDGETKSLPSDNLYFQAWRTCLSNSCYLGLSEHLQGM